MTMEASKEEIEFVLDMRNSVKRVGITSKKRFT